MHHVARAPGQKANFIVRFHATASVQLQMGEHGCAGDVKPVEFPGHPGARFVQVYRLGSLNQVFLEGCVDRRNLLGDLDAGFHHRPVAGRLLIQVCHDLAGALHRNVMVLVEVHPLRLDRRAILHRLADFRRKLHLVHLSAVRAAFDPGAVFDNFHPYRRDVKHLSPLVVTHRHVFQRSLTSPTADHPVCPNVIGMCHGLERVSWMPRLGLASCSSSS